MGAQMVDQFEYLGKSVALVLGFVGGKLVAEYFGVEVSTMMSLAVVFSTLGAGIGASILLKPEDDPTETRIPERYLCEEQSRQRGVSSYTTFSRLAMRTQEPCAIHREPYASQSKGLWRGAGEPG